MNPGRFNHEPFELVFYRSHFPGRRTRVSQGGRTCAGIMNLASIIMNPLGWCFVRDRRLVDGCLATTGLVTGVRVLPLIVAAMDSPTIQRL